jgi:hypothetical protein
LAHLLSHHCEAVTGRISGTLEGWSWSATEVACQAVGIEVGDLLERHTGDRRELLRPVAEAAVDCLGLGVEEADGLATSRGFHLERISPTADGPYPMHWTFNLDAKRIVAIVDEETVTEVHVG